MFLGGREVFLGGREVFLGPLRGHFSQYPSFTNITSKPQDWSKVRFFLRNGHYPPSVPYLNIMKLIEINLFQPVILENENINCIQFKLRN